jgi:hypothetical protein
VPFKRGCKLGFVVACENLSMVIRGAGAFASAPPALEDYAIVLRGSKGAITGRNPSALYARACNEGWPDTCGRAGAAGGR